MDNLTKLLDDLEAKAKAATPFVSDLSADPENWLIGHDLPDEWAHHIAAWSPDFAARVVAVLRAAQERAYNGHSDLCKVMMERAGRACNCGHSDLHAALAALGEVNHA